MKKKFYLIYLFILLFSVNGCTGYKPIFSSSNLEFKIDDYTIEGDKILGKMIYYKLNSLSKLNANNQDAKSIDLIIHVSKDKKATSKDSAGKILEYKISLNANIKVKDLLDDRQMINQNFTSSSTYKVQDQYSETVKLENKSIENLIDKTYQDLLVKLSQNFN